ncbi:carbohydrate deacetylase [Oscillospiraceae bacterium OttesenSCG-928-G22]|nr:carbohydrate deacetylase [Oscillospiraceae bacterium OttesenSCG-928-G22]
MKLIVNADDFGLCEGVNHGIFDAFRRGIVTSASILAGGRAFSDAAALLQSEPKLPVGIHLTLTHGAPLCPGARTFVGEDGRFLRRDAFWAAEPALDPDEIRREFTAQIERVISAGISPDHLDSHHHIHYGETVLPVFLDVAARYGLPVRMREENQPRSQGWAIKSPDITDESFSGREDVFRFLQRIQEYSGGEKTVELMCHPGFADEYLMENSSYNLPRLREHAILTNGEVRKAIAAARQIVTAVFHQISFRDL